MDLLRDLVLLRFEALKGLEPFHRILQLVDQLVLNTHGQGGGLLPQIHLRDVPREGAQLPADVRSAGGPRLAFQLDEGLRLGLELVPRLPMGPGLGGERRSTIAEGSESIANLSLLLVDEVALLAQLLRLRVQDVPSLAQALELDFCEFEFRSGLFPDQTGSPDPDTS